MLQLGRKALLLLGGAGMFLAIFIAASIILTWRVRQEEAEGGVAGYMVVIFICFFVFNFAYGWG